MCVKYILLFLFLENSYLVNYKYGYQNKTDYPINYEFLYILK